MMGDKLKAHLRAQMLADIKVALILFMLGVFLGVLFT